MSMLAPPGTISADVHSYVILKVLGNEECIHLNKLRKYFLEWVVF